LSPLTVHQTVIALVLSTNGAFRYSELMKMEYNQFHLVLLDMAIVNGISKREMEKEMARTFNSRGSAWR